MLPPPTVRAADSKQWCKIASHMSDTRFSRASVVHAVALRPPASLVLTACLLTSCAVSELSTPMAIDTPRAADRPLTTTAPPAGTPVPTATDELIPTPQATVERIQASVTADLLSCRYGPGPDYLYLYALRGGANIVLIGRTDGGNWHWVYVEGTNRCWVNVSFLHVDGNWRTPPHRLSRSGLPTRDTVLSADRRHARDQAGRSSGRPLARDPAASWG